MNTSNVSPAPTERLKWQISRFDHYFESINTKGNVYLAINGFIFGSLLTGFDSLNRQFHFGPLDRVLILAVIVASFGAVVLTTLAINPFVGKGSYRSLVYFGSVANSYEADFLNALAQETPESFQADLARQVHALACGLQYKYAKLRSAGGLMLGSFLLLLIVFMDLLTTT